MNVAILLRSLNVGGAERQAVELAIGLHNLGVKVNVIVFYGGGRLSEDLEKNGVPILYLGNAGRWDFAGAIWRLTGIVKKLKTHVLLSYTGTPNIAAAVTSILVPKLKVVWGVRSAYRSVKTHGLAGRLAAYSETCLSRIPNLIITNSNDGKKAAVERGFPKEKIIVIHNGIDTNRFNIDPEAGKRVRHLWNLNLSIQLVGIVARLSPVKDHETFLRAFEIVSKRMPSTHAVIVGTGPEETVQRLKSLATSLGIIGNITWAGDQKDMPAVYNSLNVLCSSSTNEGFSNSIAEAMSCGVPCVVTDVGDSAIIVGKDGVLCHKSDPKALALGILQILREDTHIERNMLRKQIVERFGANILVERTYQQLINLAESVEST